ncbi:uncharacterized protein VTP21DRAFT_1533 [Calcarisporiella thermophila]|uniref:uncharacterized protein n=1 Tax=Calcarisporiella thermophila TaxID=911321 RepID=UPI0037421529
MSSQPSPDPVDRARILVIGDAGVGKSSLIHMLCHEEPLRVPSHTVGFHIDVKIYTPSWANSRPIFLEFLEVPSNSKHPQTLQLLQHQQVHAVILVHDCCNSRSYKNLWRWIERISKWVGVRDVMGGQESDLRLSVPILVVGTKSDLAVRLQELQGRLRRCTVAKKFGGDAITLCAISPGHFTPSAGVTYENIVKFFDTVVEHRFGGSGMRNGVGRIEPAGMNRGKGGSIHGFYAHSDSVGALSSSSRRYPL